MPLAFRSRNYTGGLIGATVIPAWNTNACDLPLLFGVSGLSSAVAVLELMGHEKSHALGVLGLAVALFECWEGLRIEARKRPAQRVLKRRLSGALISTGGVLSDPLPAAMRLVGLLGGRKRAGPRPKAAAVTSLNGALLTRIAWVHAGHVSARDWRLPLEAR